MMPAGRVVMEREGRAMIIESTCLLLLPESVLSTEDLIARRSLELAKRAEDLENHLETTVLKGLLILVLVWAFCILCQRHKSQTR